MGLFPGKSVQILDESLAILGPLTWITAHLAVYPNVLQIVTHNSIVCRSHLYFRHPKHSHIYHRSVNWCGIKLIKLHHNQAKVLCTTNRHIYIRFECTILQDHFVSQLLSRSPLGHIANEQLQQFLGAQQLAAMQDVNALLHWHTPPPLYLINHRYLIESSSPLARMAARESIIATVAHEMARQFEENLKQIRSLLIAHDHSLTLTSLFALPNHELVRTFLQFKHKHKLMLNKRGQLVPQNSIFIKYFCIYN